jgi:hypothetical protein
VWLAFCPDCFEAVETLREFVKVNKTCGWRNLGVVSHKCFSEGADQAFDGAISIEMDNTSGDRR